MIIASHFTKRVDRHQSITFPGRSQLPTADCVNISAKITSVASLFKGPLVFLVCVLPIGLSGQTNFIAELKLENFLVPHFVDKGAHAERVELELEILTHN